MFIISDIHCLKKGFWIPKYIKNNVYSIISLSHED